MDISEVKRDARNKVESLMGMFEFLNEKFNAKECELVREKQKLALLQGVLIGVRQELRNRKMYDLADSIRDGLQKTGVKIGDTG